jgi:putative adhesin
MKSLHDSRTQRSVSHDRNNELEESSMQKYDTPSPVTAVLDIPAGRIRFIAADRTDTTVEILPADPAKGRDVKAAEQTTAAYGDGVLRIQGPTGNRIGNPGSVEVTVQLPAGSRVEAKAASAEFRAVGRLGDVTLDGAQATVKIDEAATARLTVADGDVTVGRLRGDAEIRTSRGDIQVTEAASGTVTLATQAGSITAGAAAGVSAALDAGTTLGRVHNALKNDGTPALTIHATTAMGDITARSL